MYGHLSEKSPAEDGTSWAEQTLDTLTELSAEEIRDELAPLYASLKEHGEQVKLDREARAKNLAKLEVDTAEGKFTQLPTAAYGDKDSFHQGLEVLGLPHPDVLTEMKREFLGAPDSGDAFTAWNSGPNETNCIKEWHFVVGPFKDTPGWQDLSPEAWTPRYEYGGNRIPIRVEVFMHAMSASPCGEKCLGHRLPSCGPPVNKWQFTGHQYQIPLVWATRNRYPCMAHQCQIPATLAHQVAMSRHLYNTIPNYLNWILLKSLICILNLMAKGPGSWAVRLRGHNSSVVTIPGRSDQTVPAQ